MGVATRARNKFLKDRRETVFHFVLKKRKIGLPVAAPQLRYVLFLCARHGPRHEESPRNRALTQFHQVAPT